MLAAHRAGSRVVCSASTPTPRSPQSAAPAAVQLSRRTTLTAALCTLATALAGGRPALAAASEPLAAQAAGEAAAAAAAAPTPVYFGSGCFWGRQYDFVNAEKALGRSPEQLTAVVGYGGGKRVSADGRVCYYVARDDSVYERLGHAEVVQVELDSNERQAQQFREFAKTYFSQFRKTPFGMIRQDPQDVGPGYRNVVGIPGGMASPLFKVLQEENVNGMRLLPGSGDEGDEINTVYVADSTAMPFHRAERYHQYHNGLGHAFPKDYTQDLKRLSAKVGRIDETGCPEYFF